MFNEIVCLCAINEGGYANRLMTLDEVSENMTILLAFYHPDGQSDCDKINKLQADGVNLVAIVDANDTRQLPEQAFAMICCDDVKFIAQLIFNAITTNSLLRIDWVDVLMGLAGSVFHHYRFVGRGDRRIQMMIEQSKSIISIPSKQLCFCHGDFDMSELIEFFSYDEAEFLAYSLDHDLGLGDEIVMDMLYSPISQPISD